MRKILGLLMFGLYGCGSVESQVRNLEPVKVKEETGNWRDGYKAAYAKALTFKTWEELYDWAESGSSKEVLPFKKGRSTDLAGGRHDYIDTKAGGFKDACIGLIDEMTFIGNHNSGGTEQFFKLMREWMQMQNLDRIIPPGHF